MTLGNLLRVCEYAVNEYYSMDGGGIRRLVVVHLQRVCCKSPWRACAMVYGN
jgi:hypothetical protein